MIEVGEYIRTNEGEIAKVIKIEKREKFEDKIFLDINSDDTMKYFIYNFDIKAHSKNIIDLIEAGDYVNGIRINKKFAIKTNPVTNHKYLEYNYGFENVLNDFEIKTILTHEQYEQNCYKVGDII